MFNALLEILSYPFMLRALLVGVSVSLCAALLGVTLVLKRYSMIGDGLSHVAFGALAVATAAGAAPLPVAIPVVLLSAFLLLRLNEGSRIRGDAATAIVSSSALAVGVIAVSLSTGMNIDVYNYMFGAILAISSEDVAFSLLVTCAVLFLYIRCYNRIFAVTFDEDFAKATGVGASRYDTLIAVLTALVIVTGIRMMGAMLISSLIIFPALSSMRVFSSFKGVVLCSAVLSVICFLVGITASFIFSLPTGASVVAANMTAFCAFLAAEKFGKG
ncbi:ABC transporter [Synergistales bacterium]|nr:ABC transporter [Synergistales bacterium]